MSQTFQYDWLGNTTQTGDDAGGFYDRSLGTITNGTPSAGPYQLQCAAGGAAPRDGSLTTSYDPAGNLVGLSVERNAAAPCLLTSAPCSQFFAYDWDEVGRLVRARRWDGNNLGVASGPLPAAATAVDLQYAYDGNDDRVVKTAVDSSGNALFTVYIADSLELRRTTFEAGDYVRDVWTEVPYLFANGERLARVHYATDDVPTLTSGNLHVLLEVQDFLGSTAIVLDQATGELVEDGTYEAYGATESDYRPERWNSYREDYRFTGKEEDVEVGLQYFGKRYYAPGLGRWVSADPLAVHGLGADANVYAYVQGRALRAVDPVGLADTGATMSAQEYGGPGWQGPVPATTTSGASCPGGCHGSQPAPATTVPNVAGGGDVSREDIAQLFGSAKDAPQASLPSVDQQGAGQPPQRFNLACANDCHTSKSRGEWAGIPGPTPNDPGPAGSILIGTVGSLPGVGTLYQFVQAGQDASHGDYLHATLHLAGAVGTVLPLRGLASSNVGVTASSASEIAGAGGPRASPFNPSGSMSNCVNSVCAFLNSVQDGRLVTASADVAENGGRIARANAQIIDATGVRMSLNFQYSSLETARSRQFFVVYKGASATTAEHVLVGINNGGRTMLYDPQIGSRISDIKSFGPFVAFPVAF